MDPKIPTQNLVDIAEVKQGVVYLKNNSLCRVLMVGGINFDLKSEAEQQQILNAFQNFLNTLDYSVQFLIHSRKINIQSYLEKIEGRYREENNELLKIQINEYIDFIKNFVTENPIIIKSFFVAVRYDASPLMDKGGFFSIFKSVGKGGNKAVLDASVETNVQQLAYRTEQVLNGLAQVGLHVEPLDDQSVIELFYNLYNPQLVDKSELLIAGKDKAAA